MKKVLAKSNFNKIK